MWRHMLSGFSRTLPKRRKSPTKPVGRSISGLWWLTRRRQKVVGVIVVVTLILILTIISAAVPLITRTSASSIESSLLQLIVTSSPYAYTVVENSNSTVLVSQSFSTFVVNGTTYTTASASNISTTASTLDADLTLTPAGASAHVHFAFLNPQVLRVQLTLTSGTPSQEAETFNDQGEHYYGAWEFPYNGSLDNRGVSKDMLGDAGDPTVINASNGRAPFYTTSLGYAIYTESQGQGHYSFAINRQTSFSFYDTQLTYDIIYGPGYDAMLAQYTGLAGGAYMPPLWALDSIWWKDDEHDSFPPGVTNAQENVLDTATQLQNYQIPAAGYWIDRPYGTGYEGWGNMDFDSSFPDPAQMVSDLHAKGLHLMLWISDHAWNNLYTQGSADGYLYPGTANDGPAPVMTNPAAYSWIQQQLNTFVNLGIEGYKLDRGDDNEMPAQNENQENVLFAQMAAEGLAAANNGQYFVFARSMYDTGRQYAALWNGDSLSSFAGLAASVASGLRAGAINFPMWGSDSGGYVHGPPTEELFARWLEFSSYSPMMEVLVGAGRTPWYNYDSTLVNITRSAAETHHNLMPYTRSFLYQATQTGMPVMRPLVFAYPNDPNVALLEDEYLYGSELLVAPVVTQGATSRSVYLPAGNWVDDNDKTTTYAGGQTITANAPLDTIPVFAREGAIIPRGDILQSNNNWTPNWAPSLDIEFFPSDTQPSTFSYYTGSAVKTIQAAQSDGALNITTDDLGLGGMLEVHAQNVTTVVRNGITLGPGDYTYDPSTDLLSVSFSGATDLTLPGAYSIFPASPLPPTSTPTPGP